MIQENNIEKQLSVLDTTGIDGKITDLANQVINETDINKTKDLIALFNWNISKKNVARILKLNGLYDSVSDQMVTRFQTKADQFSNDDLLNYLKVIQGAIDTSSKNLNQVEEPPIIVQNNTQINVNMVDDFDRDAKERILQAIQATLKAAQMPHSEPEPIEVEVQDEPVETTLEEPLIEVTAEKVIEELNSQLPNEGDKTNNDNC